MALKWSKRVWKLRGVSGTKRCLLLALAECANDAGECWPSIPTLAEMCDVTERALYKHMKPLRGKYFTVDPRGRGVKYTLTLDATPEQTDRGEEEPTPEQMDTEQMDTEQMDTEQMDRGTPEQMDRLPLSKRSPEPSRTIIEPSKEAAAAARARGHKGLKDLQLSHSDRRAYESTIEELLNLYTPSSADALAKRCGFASTGIYNYLGDRIREHGFPAVCAALVMAEGECSGRPGRKFFDAILTRITTGNAVPTASNQPMGVQQPEWTNASILARLNATNE